MVKLWILIFLLITSISYAQNFQGGFQDFGSSFSNSVFNDTELFSGPGILGASDITVQDAFQTLDTSGATLITACQISDDFCYKFSSGILTLYMSSVAHQQWPVSIAVGDFVLLESGDKLLLEDGSSFLLLE